MSRGSQTFRQACPVAGLKPSAVAAHRREAQGPAAYSAGGSMQSQGVARPPDRHDHSHGRNRFAVIPTAQRVGADVRRTGRGVTIAFLDSGFYPHPDLTEPLDRILAYVDVT